MPYETPRMAAKKRCQEKLPTVNQVFFQIIKQIDCGTVQKYKCHAI